MRVEDVRNVLAVARAGTVTGAAATSHRSIAAMSDSVRRVERALGVDIFERSNQGMNLSDEGAQLVHCLEAFDRAANKLVETAVMVRGARHLEEPERTPGHR